MVPQVRELAVQIRGTEFKYPEPMRKPGCVHTHLIIPADGGLLELAGYQSRSRFREKSCINRSKANMRTSDANSPPPYFLVLILVHGLRGSIVHHDGESTWH